MTAGNDWNEKFTFSDFKRAGDMIFFSAQVGLDESGNAPTDPASQYHLAFESLAKVLSDAGCTPNDLVDLTSFHTNYPENMDEFAAAKSSFQGTARPAWTAVGVERLGKPQSRVYLKAVAYAPR